MFIALILFLSVRCLSLSLSLCVCVCVCVLFYVCLCYCSTSSLSSSKPLSCLFGFLVESSSLPMRMRAPSSFESPFPPLEHAKSSRSFSLFFSHFPATTTFQRLPTTKDARVLACPVLLLLLLLLLLFARDEELKICARREMRLKTGLSLGGSS